MNELDIKECLLVLACKEATVDVVSNLCVLVQWMVWTRISGIEGQVNGLVMRSLFLKLEWPDIIFYNLFATCLTIQQDHLFTLGLVGSKNRLLF